MRAHYILPAEDELFLYLGEVFLEQQIGVELLEVPFEIIVGGPLSESFGRVANFFQERAPKAICALEIEPKLADKLHKEEPVVFVEAVDDERLGVLQIL